MMGYNWGWNNEWQQGQQGGAVPHDNDKCWSVDQGVDDKEVWSLGSVRDQEVGQTFISIIYQPINLF